MSNWNPFRKLSNDEQRAIELRFPGEQCAVCGKTMRKGERALPMRSTDRSPAVDGMAKLYPRYDGSQSLNPTYRHLGCSE